MSVDSVVVRPSRPLSECAINRHSSFPAHLTLNTAALAEERPLISPHRDNADMGECL